MLYSSALIRETGLILSLAFMGLIHATPITWNGGGINDLWSTSANWGGSPLANNGSATTRFDGSVRTSPNIDAAWSVLGVEFLPGASSFTLNGSALTTGAGGISQQSPNAQTIIAPLLVNGSQSWTASTAKLVIGSTAITTDTITLGASTLTFTGANHHDLHGEISGTGSVIKSGSGTLTITSNQTFTGGLNILGGTVDIGGSFLRLGPSNATVTINGGTIRTDNITNLAQTFSLGASGGTFESTNATPFISGKITGGGQLIKSGNGNLRLSNNTNDYSGGTSVNAGTLFASNTSLKGHVSNHGTVDFSAASTYANGTITGTGTVRKSGTGTLEFSNASIQTTGSLEITGGSITTGNTAIQCNLLHMTTGNTLLVNSTLLGTGVEVSGLTGTGNIQLGTASSWSSFTVDHSTDFTSSHHFSGGSLANGARLVKSGGGTLTLSGDNHNLDYLQATGGTLRFSSSNSFPKNLSLHSGGTVSINQPGLATSCNLQLAGNATIDTDSHSLSWTGAITGPGPITKTGSGMLTFPLGGGTLQQPLVISDGTVQLQQGYGSGAPIINNAFLEFDGFYTETTEISGSGLIRVKAGGVSFAQASEISASMIHVQAGTLSNLGSHVNVTSVSVNTGASIDLSLGIGAISSTFEAGDVSMEAGSELELWGISDESSSSAVIESLSGGGSLNIGPFGYLLLDSGVQEAASLTGEGFLTIDGAFLTLGADGSSFTYSGVISGSGGINKAGAGIMTLTLPPQYTGETAVSGGTLALLSAGLADASTVRLQFGGVLHLGFSGIDTIQTLQIDGSSVQVGLWGRPGHPQAQYTTPSLTGDGLLFVSGNSHYYWTGNDPIDSWTSASNWSPGIPPNDVTSTVIFGSGPAAWPLLSSSTSVKGIVFSAAAQAFTLTGESISLHDGGVKNDGSTLQRIASPVLLSANQTWASTSGPLTIGDAAFSSTGINLLHHELTVHATQPITLEGVIGGTGGLRKQGAGSLIVTRENSYTGVTDIEQGILVVRDGDALGSATPGTIVQPGAALAIELTSSFSESLVISGNGPDLAGAINLQVPLLTLTMQCPQITLNAPSSISISGIHWASVCEFDSASSIALGSHSLTINPSNYYGTVEINSSLSGDGDLILEDLPQGIYFLLGNNSGFNGEIQLLSGILAVNSSGVGSSTAGVMLSNDTILLVMSRSTITNEPLTMAQGAIMRSTGSATWTGSQDIQLTGDATIATASSYFDQLEISGEGLISGEGHLTLESNDDDELVISREIALRSTDSIIATGNGILRLHEPMAADQLLVNNGHTILENPDIIPQGRLYIGSSATVTLAGGDQACDILDGFGDIHLGSHRLLVGGVDASNLFFSGNVTGSGGITKTGSGHIIMTAAPLYTGSTIIEGGTLVLSNAGLSDTAEVRISASATLSLNFASTDVIRRLFIGGVPMPPGVWGSPASGAPNISPSLAGIGTLMVTEGNEYLWTGLGNDDDWSTAPNWLHGEIPMQDGLAVAVFDGATRTSPQADVVWNLSGLRFAPMAGAFSLGGEPLTIGAGGMINLGTELQSIANTILATGPQTWSASGGPMVIGGSGGTISSDDIVTLHTPHYIHLLSDWSAVTSLIKSGNGELLIAGTIDVPDITLTAGATRLAASNRIADLTTVILGENAEWNLNGHSETIGSLQSDGAVSLGEGSLRLNGSSLIAGSISGGGQLIANAGSSVIDIAGSAAHTGGTWIQSGVMRVLDGGNIAGTIHAAAGTWLMFQISSDATYHGHFTGGPEARFIQSSPAVLTLAGATTHTGRTDVQTGTLRLGASERISDASDLIVQGTFDLAGHDETLLTIEGAGDVLLGGGTLDFTSVGSFYRGRILDAGMTGHLIKRGAGFWHMENLWYSSFGTVLEAGSFDIGEGSFTADDIDITLGDLSVAEDASAYINEGSWQSSAVALHGALAFGNSSTTPAVKHLGSLSGNGNLSAGGPMNLYATSITGNGSVVLQGPAPSTETFTSFQLDHDIDQSIGWSITGNVQVDENDEITDGNTGFAKSGSGTLTIDRPLRHLAEISVSEGVLAFSDVADLGSHYLLLQNSATLRVTATGQILELPIYGGNSPAVDTGTHTLTTTGLIFFGDDELRKKGSGTLVLQSGSVHSGRMIIEQGTVTTSSALNLENLMHVELASGTTLNLAGNQQNIGMIEGSGHVLLGGANLNLGTLQEGTYTFSGMISGAGNFSKSNSSTLTLAHAPEWQGSTSVLDGSLILLTPGLDDLSSVYLDSDATLVLDFVGQDSVSSLHIGGLPMASGTWGAPGSGAQHETERISGSGMLRVLSAFESWILGQLAAGEDTAFIADPDSDGLTNGIEFVLGSHPGVAETGAARLALIPTMVRSGNSATFSFRRTHRSTYLNPVTEISTNLQVWTAAAPPLAGISVQESAIDTETELISVTFPIPPDIPGELSIPRCFARLSVTGP